MFAAQRIAKIKSILLDQKSTNIAALCSVLDVSDVTVRKDLDKLENEGFLIKTHGGAVLVDNQPKTQNILIEKQLLKDKIAELALTLIEEGDTIFLGPGSTCFLFSQHLKKFRNIIVITNNINALHELSTHIRSVFLIGGELNNLNGMLYSAGQTAISYLDGLFVSKAFFSVDGIDLEAGLTINERSQMELLQKLPSVTKQVIILADQTKFDKIGLYQIFKNDFPSCIITNEKISGDYKRFFFENNVKMLTTYDIEELID